MEYWVGCDADGRLTALRARMVGDSGAYASVGMKVLERAAGHASGPYHVPAIDVESVAVRTNNPICGAFRGFGANQAQFAMEGVPRPAGRAGRHLRLGDPQAQRHPPGQVWGPGQVMDDGCLGAERCLDEIRPDYDAAVAAGKAVGLGLGLKNSGLGNGFKEVIQGGRPLPPDGTVEVRHCWTEMGQGVHTVALQVAVEELGDRPGAHPGHRRHPRARRRADDRQPRHADGRGRGGRRLRAAKADGCRSASTTRASTGSTGRTSSAGRAPGHPLDVRLRRAAGGHRPRDRAIEQVVAVHDVGRAVNPLLCEGQIEGSVHMGLGYALTEDFPADPRPASRPT